MWAWSALAFCGNHEHWLSAGLESAFPQPWLCTSVTDSQQTRSGCQPRGPRSSEPWLLNNAARTERGKQPFTTLMESVGQESGWAQLGRPVSPPGSPGLSWGLESSQDSCTPCLMLNTGCQLEAWAPFHVDSWCGPAEGSSQHGDWFPQSNHP